MAKKIGILTVAFTRGGAEYTALQTAIALRNNGYEVELFALFKGGLVEQRIREQGFRYTVFNFNYVNKLKSYLKIVISLAKAFRRAKIDAIITVSYYPLMFGIVAAFVAGIRERYAFYVGKEWEATHSRKYRFALRFVKKFIANSVDVKNFIQNYLSIRDKPIEILYNIYSERVAENSGQWWREKLNIEDHKPVVLLVGNYFYSKDHLTVIRAIDILVKSGVNAQFVFCGYAPDENYLYKLKALAFDLKLCTNLIFLPNTEDVFGLMQMANVGIFSAIKRDTEGFPIVIMEYMQNKLPFVAAKIPCIEELLVNLKNRNFLYEPENPQDLADKVIALLDNRSLAEDIANENYHYVMENHKPVNYDLFFKKFMNNG